MYALVYWEEENSYSVVARKKIISGLEDNELEGKSLPIVWKANDEPQNGTVIKVGSKKEMRKEEESYVKIADELSFDREELMIQGIDCEKKLVRKRQRDLDELETPSSSSKIAKKRARDVVTQVQSDLNVYEDGSRVINQNGDSQANNEDSDSLQLPQDCRGVVPTTGSETEVPEVAEEHFRLLNEKNETIRSLEIKLGKFERENRVYKRMLKSRDAATMNCETDEMESLSDGVFVSKGFMYYLRIGYKSRPSQFFRQLVFESGLFGLQEVADCSINGKWLNRPKSGRPGLDSVKIQAVKAATILHCGLKEKTWAMAEFERKILTVCSDARKKLQRLALKKSNVASHADEPAVPNLFS